MRNVGLRSTIGAVLGAATLVLTATVPAQAIRFGEPDRGEHPYVGLMVAFVGGTPAWRCSGSLITTTLFLTAGHCTSGADHVEIWFDEHVERVSEGGTYPFGPGDVGGTPFTHPEFDDAQFLFHDVGVVELDDPVTGLGTATLASLGMWDQYLKPGNKKAGLAEPVGYGLQRKFPANNPKPDSANLDRMKAETRIIGDSYGGGIGKGVFIIFSGNADTGGTCNGDSGGPIFKANTNVVGAVVSFGKNFVCAGQGGGYRIDQADDLAFIHDHM